MPIFYTPSYFYHEHGEFMPKKGYNPWKITSTGWLTLPLAKFSMHLFLFGSGALCILRQEEPYSPGPETSLWKSLLIDILLPDSATKYSRAEILGLIITREGERYLLLLTSASPMHSQYSTESQPSGSMNQEGIQAKPATEQSSARLLGTAWSRWVTWDRGGVEPEFSFNVDRILSLSPRLG